MVVGFSTGSLALGDFRLGLQMVKGTKTAAIELSALRDYELRPLIESLDSLDLEAFEYISVHAPSRFESLTENEVVQLLEPVFARNWPVVIHPDTIEDCQRWRAVGDLVCVENMDKRKYIGRTAEELESIFEMLPNASMCFDIAHARQIDPTMMEAQKILRQHRQRIRQIHLSTVVSSSRHEALSYPSLFGYESIVNLLPNVPVILETPVTTEQMSRELEVATSLFSGRMNN